MTANLPARPFVVGFREVVVGDVPLAVGQEVGGRRPVEPVGAVIEFGFVFFGFNGEFVFDLLRDDAIHEVGFVHNDGAAFAEADADVPVTQARSGGDFGAVAVGTAGVGFQQLAVYQGAVRTVDVQPQRGIAEGFAVRGFEEPQGVDGVFRAVSAAIVPGPVVEGRIGLFVAVCAFVREVDALPGNAQVGEVVFFLADDVAGGVRVFAAGLRTGEAGNALAVGFGFAKDAVVLRVEGDFLMGDRGTGLQVAQFGEDAVAGLIGGQALIGNGEAEQGALGAVFVAHAEDVHACTGIIPRHVFESEAALRDGVALAFFRFEAALPDKAGVVVKVVFFETVGVIDRIVRIAGEVIAGNLPQFDVDFAASVRGFNGQRGVWREFEGFATGSKAHQRRTVTGVDSAFNRHAEFHVVLGGEFGIDFEGIFGLPLAGVAEFIASVAAFAFGRGGNTDVLFPVLQRLGEDGVIEFKADTRFVLVIVAVDVAQVEGVALAQVVVLFALFVVVLVAQFIEGGNGKRDAVAVVLHDGFIEGEGVIKMGSLRATYVCRGSKQGAVGGFLGVVAIRTIRAAIDKFTQ